MEQDKCNVTDLNDYKKLNGRLQMMKCLIETNFHLEQPEFYETILEEMGVFVPLMNQKQKSLWNELFYIATNALMVTNVGSE